MADNVIKEFLVSLGFEADGADKFGKQLDWAQAKAVALGEAMYDAAKEITKAVADMVTGFDQLYWQSKNLGSAAGDIKEAGYAWSQLGGSVGMANAAMKSISDFTLSLGGGGRSYLAALGVAPQDLGDAAKTMRDLEVIFQRMVATGGPNALAQVNQVAGVIGISSDQLRVMLRDSGEYEKQYASIAGEMGVNLDDASKASNDLMIRVRMLQAQFELWADNEGVAIIERMVPYFKEIAQWVDDLASGKKLSGISGEIQTLVSDVGALISAFEKLAASPALQTFGGAIGKFLIEAFDDAIKAATQLVNIVTDILHLNWHQAWLDATAQNARPFDGAAPGGNPSAVAPPASQGGAATPKGSPSLNALAERFTARGASPAAASAIAAGILAEGGKWDSANPKGAFGIGQWMGPRRAALFAKYGRHPSMHQQLDFLWSELSGGDRGGASVLGSKDADSALLAYVYKFMRPQGAHNEHIKDAIAEMGRGRGFLAGANPFHATLGSSHRSSSISQQTTINVNGAGDPRAVADSVAAHQDKVNQSMVGNAGVFAY